MIRSGVVGVVVSWVLIGCGPAPKADPCSGVDCGAGRCALVAGAPACVCDQGFTAAGLTCAALPAADLCASNPCANLTNALCQVNAGRVSCVCPTTRVEVGGSCVLRSACVPNPCMKPRRTTCEVAGGVASCRCDPGFAPEGDGCSAAPVWTCQSQHSDGDSSEADECPSLARTLGIDADERRTLAPAGDHDWFQIGVTPGHLFSFTATADLTMPLLIEVFDTTGVTLLASDNRGSAQAQVAFVAPALQTLMVRVRGVRASDTGGYTVRYVELGVDDYVNTTTDALTLLPGPNAFSGEVQYAGDRDVVWLELPALTAIKLAMPDAGADLVIEIERPDGGLRALTAGEETTITTATVERLSLTARGRNPRNEGAFSLSFAEFGADDHSDEPAFGTPLASDNLWVSGRFERSFDVDSFTVGQLADRLYRVRWLGQSSTPVATVMLASGTVVGNNSYGTTALVWKADQSRSAAVRLQLSYGSGAAPPYTVALEDLGFDDHSDTLSNATSATVNVPVSGRLELVDDVDTFSFTATAGRIMQVTALQTGTANSTTLQVRVFDAQGTVIGEADGTVGVLAMATGLYKVQVERSGYSFNQDLVGYTLTVNDQGLDDHLASSAGATALTVGTTITGSVQYASDIDAFAFNTLAGHVYDVSCTRTPGTCAFQVKDPSGQVVTASGGGSTNSFLAITAARWIVEVNGGPSYSPTLGPYALNVTDRGPEDHGATAATATALTVGTPVAGTIGFSADVDVFSFSATAGDIYGATVSPGGSLRIEVRDGTNTVVVSSYGSSTSFVAPSTGTFYVFVSGGYSSVIASYSVTVTDRGVDDHSNTASGATALTLGVAQAGSVQYQGDADFFTVAVVAGHHHLATCTGNCSLNVLDASGTVLATSYGGSGVAFKPITGTTSVFFRVLSSSETATYSLLVSDLGADDHGDGRSDATVLVLDAAATSGVLETAVDLDAFTVVAAAGEIVRLTCTTTSGSACGLTVTPPSGNVIVQPSPAALVRTGFLASGTGSYLVQVRSGGYATGAYTLAATRGTDDFTVTTPITAGTPRTGAIDYVGDTDLFSLALTVGVAVQVNLSSGARAAVTSPTGGYVPTIYGGYTVSFNPTATGTYVFAVASDSYYGTLSSYSLTVQ